MNSRRQFLELGAAGGVLAAVPASSAWADQGVTRDQIVIGSIQDLSGPLVTLGKPIQNGMIMRAEQINAEGGIHGRKIRLVVEDLIGLMRYSWQMISKISERI
ncbi:MAG: ABC transporter substrate-binding protein [Burkholderiaceae bacterium]